jgi:hypothetical protein
VQGSAFYADHRSEKTAFGQFLALVADDLIPVGTVLLVDGLSRFGRYDAMQALEDVNALIKGIELHSVTPGKRRIYNRDSLQDPDTINKLVNELAQARAESAEKQRLALSAKREARERAINDGAPIPGMLPPWIKLVGHNKRLYKQSGGQLGGDRYVRRDGSQYDAKGNLLYGADGKPLYDPRDDRVAIVRRIWEAHRYVGALTIVKMLIAEGLPCWGKSGTWSKPTIEDLLTDIAVIGVARPTMIGTIIIPPPSPANCTTRSQPREPREPGGRVDRTG